MTYEEVKQKALEVKWKVSNCKQGAQCWCRIIEPLHKLFYTENGFDGAEYEEEYYIVGSGAINTESAEHIVEIHNQFIKNQNK